MARLYWTASLFALTLLCAASRVAFASSPPAWFHVSVAGQALTPDDIYLLEVHMLDGASYSGAVVVQKDPSEMPPFAKYIWFAGRRAGRPTIWIVRTLQSATPPSDEVTAEIGQEQYESWILAMLDGGKGGTALQKAYASTPVDAQSHQKLAVDVMRAMQDASTQVAAESAVQRRWVLANIHAGTPRASVLRTLAAQNITIEKQDKPSRPLVASFPGHFQPGCSFSTDLTFTFDANDRLEKIDVSQPIPDCL